MQFQKIEEKVIIVDFGSQITKLIARRVRELGLFRNIYSKEIRKISDFQK